MAGADGALPVLIAAVFGWQRFAAPGKAIDSIAVLPFTSVGNDPQMEYLSDGLTENLIDSLIQLPVLRVSARSTVASYKGREIDPRQAGKELQVRAVIIGRVAWQSERFIISVELVNTADGARIWSDEFRHTRSQIVMVQSEIAREIAAKLQRRLSPASQQQLAKRHSANSKAYELYAQGRNLYLRYDRKSLERALDYFPPGHRARPTLRPGLLRRGGYLFGFLQPVSAVKRSHPAGARGGFESYRVG
jgi:TolB-like protein